jgi:hypothetical protein
VNRPVGSTVQGVKEIVKPELQHVIGFRALNKYKYRLLTTV